MSEQEEIIKLIASAYDGVGKLEAWPGILHAFTQAVGANAANFRAVDYHSLRVGLDQNLGYEEKYRKAYQDHFIKLDPYRRHLEAAQPGRLISIMEVLDPAARKRSEFYNDYEKPQGLYHGIGGVLVREAPWLILVSFIRCEAGGGYTPGERRKMGSLLPHLARAVQMHLLLEGAKRAQALAHSALDCLKLGVILVDGMGRICYVNGAAEALLRLPGGPRIEARRLTFPMAAQTTAFQKLLAGSVATGEGKGVAPGGRLRCVPIAGLGAALEIIVAPLPQESSLVESGGTQPCAAAFLSRHGQVDLPWAALAACFGLTPAEARLASKLAGGGIPGRSLRNAWKLHSHGPDPDQVRLRQDRHPQTGRIGRPADAGGAGQP